MNRNSIQLFAMFFVLALVWLATNRFAAVDQNLVASTDVTVRSGAPTVNDDIDLNFLRGYVWVDITGGDVYIAEDVTDGAAVWTRITVDGFTASYRVCASDALDTNNCDYLADGTEDEATINTALAACPAGGCLVYLSDGTFNIAESVGAAIIIQIDSNQHIIGSGVDSTTLQFTDGRGLGLDRYMFSTALGTPYGTSDWSLSGMTIVAQDATDHGVRVKGAQNGRLANLKIRHTDTAESSDEGIQFSGADGDSVRDIQLYNVIIDGFGTHNIEFASDVRDVTVWHLVTRNSDASGLNFRNGNCSGALFDAINCVDSTNTDDPRNITFFNLVAYDNGTNGIAIDRGLDLAFHNASSYSNDNHGLSADGGFPTRVLIEGGSFTENQLTGMWIDGSEWIVHDVMVVNNAQNGAALANNRNGMRIDGTGHLIRDSRVIDDQSAGTHRYAVRLDPTATNVILADNHLEAGTVGTIDDNGTGTLVTDFDYSTIMDEGSAVTQRRTVNFTGTGVTCADDAGNSRTNCTITSGGGSGSVTTVAEGGVGVGDPDIVTLDFGAGFDITESPDTEVNIVLDYTEDPVGLDTADVTGTLAAGSGGTGQTSATNDALLVGNGTGFTLRTLSDCDTAGDALNYDITTDAFSCATGYITTDNVGYDTIQDEGSGLTQRGTVNFTGTGVACVDNPGSSRTDCTITSGGGSGTVTTIAEGGVGVGDPDIVTIDFGAGFDITESPDTEVNIVLDYTEDPVGLDTADVTGTLAAGSGGTGQTAATADSILVGNGTSFTARTVSDCDAAGNALQFDITTDAFGCASGYLTTVDISDNTNLVAGTNITLTGDTLDVDDVFILNTGDVGTGAFDFGGATDFEIPNSATQTPNAAGEIAVDTTDDQLKFYGTALRVIDYEISKSAILEDPADADTFLIFNAPANITILGWSCIVDPADTTESVVVDLQETNSDGDSGVSIDTTVTCGNTRTTDDGTLSNPTIDANDWILVDIGTVTGTVSWLTITFRYAVDAS